MKYLVKNGISFFDFMPDETIFVNQIGLIDNNERDLADYIGKLLKIKAMKDYFSIVDIVSFSDMQTYGVLRKQCDELYRLNKVKDVIKEDRILISSVSQEEIKDIWYNKNKSLLLKICCGIFKE